MNMIESKLVNGSLMAFVFLMPQVTLASDSWTGFVPPSSINLNIEASGKSNKWRKGKWRSGSNFNTADRFRVNTNSSEIIHAKEYAQTQPQRKSVNPWTVNSFNKSHYGFGPSKRPWGSVPERFQKRTYQQVNYNNQPVNNNYVRQYELRPFVNNFSNRSNSLLPVSGFLPLYQNQRYRNIQPFIGRNYAYQPVGFWR